MEEKWYYLDKHVKDPGTISIYKLMTPNGEIPPYNVLNLHKNGNFANGNDILEMLAFLEHTPFHTNMEGKIALISHYFQVSS